MRMTPPVPGLLSRTVLPGGIEIDGHKIAEGTEVGGSHYVLFHNTLYFPDSFTYRPERWLVGPNASNAEKEQLRIARLAFVPFSMGSRGCIGKNMAVMEMMTTMARVLKCFDFEGDGSLGGEYQVKDAFICKKDGLMISFTPVKA